MPDHAHVGSGDPCPRCYALWQAEKIRRYMVMPLNPVPAMRPRAQDTGEPCCCDCASADVLTRMMVPTFDMARVVTGNDRWDALLLPDVRMGLRTNGLTRMSTVGDMDLHMAWLLEHGIWPADQEEHDEVEA